MIRSTALFAAFISALAPTSFAASPSPAPTPAQVVVITSPSPAPAGEHRLPTPEQEVLPNGLRVAWFLSDTLPVTDLALLVQSGNRDDEPGKSGTSELLSTLLDRGAAGMTANQIAAAVERLGASRFATADEETFSVGMHGLSPDAPVLLDLLAKLALHPEFPPAEVTREHARFLDRWSHLADYGEPLAALAFQRILAAGTSYGRGSLASAREFAAVGREDLLAYHHKNFTPKNSVLMVVGRVNQAEFRKRILEDFGGWRGEAPARDWKNYGDSRVAYRPGQVLVVDRPNLTQAQVRIGFRAPLIKSPDHYPLTVANALLGEYFNSRLNSLIRDKLGLTYGIGSSFSYSRDLATFQIASATRNEAVGQVIRKSMEVLAQLKREPIPNEEVAMAKDYLLGQFPLSTATLGAVASRWLSGYVFERGPDFLNEFVPKVSAVDAPAVSAAIQRDFPLDRAVIVVAGDAKAIARSLEASGYKDIRRITPKELN